MDETARIGLPLVQAAQAQKHVTVNEAFARLDALWPLVIAGRDLAEPPEGVAEGTVYAVPEGAIGDWAGQAGRLALALGGGWAFVPPARGWTAWLAGEGRAAIHDGSDWRAGALTLSESGAGLAAGLVAGEHALAPGGTAVTGVVIPAGAMVIGATARVVEALTGTLSAWRIGTPGAEDQFGTGLGLAAGSWGRGMLGAPMTYYSDAPLVLTAEGGSFDAGRVRLAVHYLETLLPDA